MTLIDKLVNEESKALEIKSKLEVKKELGQSTEVIEQLLKEWPQSSDWKARIDWLRVAQDLLPHITK